MVILYSARHQLRVPRLARWALAAGIAATLAANVAQGLSDGPAGAIVAAWPAVSLVLSYELLLWMVRTAATQSRSISAVAVCTARTARMTEDPPLRSFSIDG